jgi:ankyrin repeat protein
MSNHDVRDRQGRTPLHAAALGGDVPEIERLIGVGANPNIGDNNGFTPLHFAAQGWHPDAASALLAGGAEVDRKNRFGNSPLFVAVFNSNGRGEMIHVLRSSGADPLSINASGQTPLGLAKLIANYDVIQYFADLETSE